jgi:hypothetical protein
MQSFVHKKQHENQIYYDTARLWVPNTLGLVNVSNRTTENKQNSYGVNINKYKII